MISETEDSIVSISELAPKMRSIDVEFKVLEKENPREVHSKRDNNTHYVTDATVGDETGVVKMTLWDGAIERVKEGQTYILKDGYTDLFRGSLRLKIGRRSKLQESDKEIEDVNRFVNKSERNSRYGRKRHYYLGY